MGKNGVFMFLYWSCILFLNISITRGATDGERKVYIVYMGALPDGESLPSSHHQSILQEVVEGRSVEDLLVRSYKRSFNGFAAKLTDRERQKLASIKEVVSVFPSRTLQLHTTRSWDFMGFNESIDHKFSTGSDVIIGVIDTGIWPESESFSDEGFGPPPKKWKGACKGGKSFTCNNKIIGARYYHSSDAGNDTARDREGHGSHTASTAAGNKVKNVSFYGLGQGTARGGVPSARIAAYKVCYYRGCEDVNILAAFDDAIADGVDIITASLGFEHARNFIDDSISIGAFHAMEKGILTLNSAGNSGPYDRSTASVGPWLLSVAASTTDRLFIDKVVLGNRKTIAGFSVNAFSQKGKKYPLALGKDVSINCTRHWAEMCFAQCLNSSLVKGKIVLCDTFDANFYVHGAGAAGSIMTKDTYLNISDVVSFPALVASPDNYKKIVSYMNSTKEPKAEILKTEIIKDSNAPVVAEFSSRGPNVYAPDIMKPDVTAPGVDILAAYSPLASLTDDGEDKRRVKYHITSGTSMSCPHAAGVAAYVKSVHPDWSSSAIKSAIMTSAWSMDASKHSAAEFEYGSGHINPVQAINPGLVYDVSKEDYIKMLCSIGFNAEKLRIISGDNSTCPKGSDKASSRDLNYPSMTAEVKAKKSFTVDFHRTVTNVGIAKSIYKEKVLQNPKLSIKVEPGELSFTALNEKKSFHVTVTGEGLPDETIVSASLVWSDGNHTVRSPIILHTIPSGEQSA